MTENIRFDLLEADDFARYVLDGQTDIAFYLRAMKDKRANLSVYAGRAPEPFLTAVVAVDDARGVLVLDAPRDAEQLEQAVAASPLVCQTALEKVKVQFMLPRCTQIEFEGHPALEAPFPGRMLRLQRRDYYRLILPQNPPLRCLMPAGDGESRLIEATVVNISSGGLAVVVPPTGVELKVEGVIDNCQITLPELGTITATLQVRNMFRVTERGGTELRAGCQFIGLPGTADALIQRYILRMERDRNAYRST